jgi:hypothetical protein
MNIWESFECCSGQNRKWFPTVSIQVLCAMIGDALVIPILFFEDRISWKGSSKCQILSADRYNRTMASEAASLQSNDAENITIPEIDDFPTMSFLNL